MRSFHPTNVLQAIEIARDDDEEFRLAPGQPQAQEVSFPPPSHTVGIIVASIPMEKEDHPKQEVKLDYGREQQEGTTNLLKL